MRVLFFGDSIMQGFWDSDGGWVQHIRKYYDDLAIKTGEDTPTIFNLGISGDFSAGVLKRFVAETEARKIGELAFVFGLGINDSCKIGDNYYCQPEQFGNNIQKLIAMAKKYSQKILFVGLTPCIEEKCNPVNWANVSYNNDRINVFNNALKAVCINNDVEFVDIFEILGRAQPPNSLLPDGLHPNGIGHKLIADIVLKKLKKIL